MLTLNMKEMSNIIFFATFCTHLCLFILSRLYPIQFTIFLVVFHLYNKLRHTHKQEMELKTCVCTSSYFCHLFTNSCWGRTYFFFIWNNVYLFFFYYIKSYITLHMFKFFLYIFLLFFYFIFLFSILFYFILFHFILFCY